MELRFSGSGRHAKHLGDFLVRDDGAAGGVPVLGNHLSRFSSPETKKPLENQGFLQLVAADCESLRDCLIPPRGLEPLSSG